MADSKPWNTDDTIGLYRFLQRVWKMAVDLDTGALRTVDAADPDIEKRLHRTIAKVGADVEKLSFNTAIAAMIEFTNAAQAGVTGDVSLAPWPDYDEAMLKDDEVEIAVQVLGKVKARVMVPSDADKETLERIALEDETIAGLIEGKTVRKVIVVPGRLVNIVG